MTLRTLFTIPAIVIVLSTLVLAGLTVAAALSGLRGTAAAIVAADRAGVAFQAETGLAAERVATNEALRAPWPLPEATTAEVAAARARSDAAIAVLAAGFPAGGESGADDPSVWSADTLLGRLRALRAESDRLLSIPPREREPLALASVMPRGLEVSRLLIPVLVQADLDVTIADPELSGVVAVSRLALSIRDQLGEIAAIWGPYWTGATAPDPAESMRILILLGRQGFLTRQIEAAIAVATPSEPVAAAFRDFAAEESVARDGLERLLSAAAPETIVDGAAIRPQPIVFRLAIKANRLRAVLARAVVRQVTDQRAAHLKRLSAVLATIGADLVCLCWSMIQVFWRLSGELATLGSAIRRIAAGDRSKPLVMRTLTTDLRQMADAVETLRQAALIADATAMRQREAEQRRMRALREALNIVETVLEPARALEAGVGRLSEGLDTAVALLAPAGEGAPPALTTAAGAARLGLAELRGTAAELEEALAAAHRAQTGARPEADIVAHIASIQAQIERRESAVRALVHPALVAFREVMATETAAEAPVALRALVADQFERIEAAVAAMASMRASMARAEAIVRDLSLPEARDLSLPAARDVSLPEARDVSLPAARDVSLETLPLAA